MAPGGMPGRPPRPFATLSAAQAAAHWPLSPPFTPLSAAPPPPPATTSGLVPTRDVRRAATAGTTAEERVRAVAAAAVPTCAGVRVDRLGADDVGDHLARRDRDDRPYLGAVPADALTELGHAAALGAVRLDGDLRDAGGHGPGVGAGRPGRDDALVRRRGRGRVADQPGGHQRGAGGGDGGRAGDGAGREVHEEDGYEGRRRVFRRPPDTSGKPQGSETKASVRCAVATATPRRRASA